MINDDKARKILDIILKDKECIERIKEVMNLRNEREFTGISEFVLNLESSVAQQYILGAFPGCVVLSRTTVERALKEELAKKGYPDRCLERLDLKNIIDSAENESIIGNGHAKNAHKIRERGNKYAHAIAKNAKGKKMSIGALARSPSKIEDWISTNEFIRNQKPDAKQSFEDVLDILYELYSENRHPL